MTPRRSDHDTDGFVFDTHGYMAVTCDTGEVIENNIALVMWQEGHLLPKCTDLDDAPTTLASLDKKKLFAIPFVQEDYPNTDAVVLTGVTQVILHDTPQSVLILA